MENNNQIKSKQPLNKEGSSVQAVERALLLLKLIGENPSPISVGDLAKQAELNRTTAWRLIGTLENQGFVEKDPFSKGYQLGYALHQITSKNDSYGYLIRRARNTLLKLKEEMGETVLLSVPKHDGTLTIDQIDTDHSVRLVDYTHTISPLHCTSNGKILLSLLPQKELDILLEQPLEPLSKYSITDPEELRKELEKIRVQKVGLSIGELDENENAISAPIFNKKKDLVAFITLGGPSFRLTKEDLLLSSDRMLEAAKEIEEQIE
ncbi:IclR family transcriptional regulator [Peribacillus huizhouensis]|uniref:DNA-binding IclR family transcriptional regulator n=1 Tax=Peribacillus huizhouensis TaxID=1501239 RepID=A0ABR6CMT1_9BACI|nr:IclR family transcriptional regulator [Peribacillus huizhouensis]MBA9025993.1 DNA-binding IclR family transcriptional regulator [Peribacillus huizhouensis]